MTFWAQGPPGGVLGGCFGRKTKPKLARNSNRAYELVKSCFSSRFCRFLSFSLGFLSFSIVFLRCSSVFCCFRLFSLGFHKCSAVFGGFPLGVRRLSAVFGGDPVGALFDYFGGRLEAVLSHL